MTEFLILLSLALIGCRLFPYLLVWAANFSTYFGVRQYTGGLVPYYTGTDHAFMNRMIRRGFLAITPFLLLGAIVVAYEMVTA